MICNFIIYLLIKLAMKSPGQLFCLLYNNIENQHKEQSEQSHQ
jgi:hypothetical protein